MSFGQNGQQFRVFDKASMESFLSEQERERKRLAAARERRHYRYQRFFAAVRRASQAVRQRVFHRGHQSA